MQHNAQNCRITALYTWNWYNIVCYLLFNHSIDQETGLSHIVLRKRTPAPKLVNKEGWSPSGGKLSGSQRGPPGGHGEPREAGERMRVGRIPKVRSRQGRNVRGRRNNRTPRSGREPPRATANLSLLSSLSPPSFP